MAETLFLTDGRIETIFDERDFLGLVDECMGNDARRWLENRLEENGEDLEQELNGVREHHKEVMDQLRSCSEKLAGLIREKDPDRKAISDTAGQIGIITWREVNR